MRYFQESFPSYPLQGKSNKRGKANGADLSIKTNSGISHSILAIFDKPLQRKNAHFIVTKTTVTFVIRRQFSDRKNFIGVCKEMITPKSQETLKQYAPNTIAFNLFVFHSFSNNNVDYPEINLKDNTSIK